MYQRCQKHSTFLNQYALSLAPAIHIGADSYISDKFGYKEDDIVMLTDDARNPRQLPTRDNIVRTSHRAIDT